jgi:hypothetical protein
MPIAYERDDQRWLITLIVTEPYSVHDSLTAIDRQAAEDTLGHAMLYDLRGVVTGTSIEADLKQMADRIRIVGGGSELGPVGIAIPPRPALFLVLLTYAQLTKELVTVDVLLTAAWLDAWLARNARTSPRSPNPT